MSDRAEGVRYGPATSTDTHCRSRLVALMNAGVSDWCQTHVRSGDTHLLLRVRVRARAREGESFALTPDPSTPSWRVPRVFLVASARWKRGPDGFSGVHGCAHEVAAWTGS